MTGQELIWRIAGGSGDGSTRRVRTLQRPLMRSGLHVFTHRHYPSRIRGGHTYVEVRASQEDVRSRGDGYNFLLALGDSFARNPQEEAYYGNEELKPLSENLDDLREGGVIVYDEGLLDEDDVAVTELEARAEENDWHVSARPPLYRQGPRPRGHAQHRRRRGDRRAARHGSVLLRGAIQQKHVRRHHGGQPRRARPGLRAGPGMDHEHDLRIPESETHEERSRSSLSGPTRSPTAPSTRAAGSSPATP